MNFLKGLLPLLPVVAAAFVAGFSQTSMERPDQLTVVVKRAHAQVRVIVHQQKMEKLEQAVASTLPPSNAN